MARHSRSSEKHVRDIESSDANISYPEDVDFDEYDSSEVDMQRRKVRRSIEDYHERRRFMKETEDPLSDMSSDGWDFAHDYEDEDKDKDN